MEETGFERFCALTGSTAKSIARIKSARMGAFHLSGAHTNCLCHLYAQGSLTQGELARLEGMDRSQVSRVLRELAAKGYVTADAQKGYKRRYVLTPCGEETAARIRQIIREINGFVSGSIPRQELRAFYHTLETIAKNLRLAAGLYAREQDAPTEGRNDHESDV